MGGTVKREFRVTKKGDLFHFRVIEGREKVFEENYEADSIMQARAKGGSDFFLSRLSEEEKAKLKTELETLGFEGAVEAIVKGALSGTEAI